MSLLDNVTPTTKRKPIITILGDAGVGKTTLAASLESPIFIRCEDGLGSISVPSFPVVEKVDDLFKQLMALITEQHEYKTVVIDSVSRLDRIFEQHIIDEDPKKPNNINTAMGGYGAGLSAVANLHGRVRKAASMLNAKGITVVFISHSDVETIDLPDEPPFNRYTLRMGKRAVPHYVDDVDIVMHIKLQTVVNSDGKKARTSGQRIITVKTSPSSPAKNRYGIEEDIMFKKGTKPLEGIL